MTKILSGLAIAILMMSTAGVARASTTDWGYISYVAPVHGGYVYFQVTGGNGRTALPSCAAANQPNRWVLDLTNPLDQGMLAVLLSAYAMRKPIVVYGTGTCNSWDPTELVNYFHTGSE